jgi:hypothetical protein
MKTKQELQQTLKTILNSNRMYEPLSDITLLEKVFRMYYDHSDSDKFTFIWDDTVELNSISIGYNRGDGYTSKGFQLKFSNGITESPSFYKAIGSLTRNEVKML